MSPDRYSDSDTEPAHSCRNGWLSAHDADVAIPCPTCRPPRRTDITDYAERQPSARAQQAIESENRE
jgi:hypothetical protein